MVSPSATRRRRFDSRTSAALLKVSATRARVRGSSGECEVDVERKNEVGVRRRARKGRCADSRWMVVSSRSAYWLMESSLIGVSCERGGDMGRGRGGAELLV